MLVGTLLRSSSIFPPVTPLLQESSDLCSVAHATSHKGRCTSEPRLFRPSLQSILSLWPSVSCNLLAVSITSLCCSAHPTTSQVTVYQQVTSSLLHTVHIVPRVSSKLDQHSVGSDQQSCWIRQRLNLWARISASGYTIEQPPAVREPSLVKSRSGIPAKLDLASPVTELPSIQLLSSRGLDPVFVL